MRTLRSLFAAFFLLVASLLVLGSTIVSSTPLDDYVNAPDPSFKWSYTGHSFDGLTYTGYVYNMTSQQWLTSAESDRSVWWHHLVVIIPKEVDPDYEDKAFLYITGGDNNNPNSFPDATDEDVFVTSTICVAAKLPGAVLFQVPNQPITFANDPWNRGGRSEDAAIALTWWQYIQDPSRPDVVLELPMTKSATKALDAMQQILPKYTIGGKAVTKFAVGGASKRGWTTWLASAVDSRVAVAIPIVLDALHVSAFFERQWTFYGAWTFALYDYYHCNITILAATSPNWKSLMALVDPYYYLSRLQKTARLVVNAVGDEFQMPDDWRSWMKAPAYDAGIRTQIMIKNAEHSLATGVPEVLTSVAAFAEGYLGNKKAIPMFSWNISADGTITVETSEPPAHVDVSVADSPGGVSQGRRDFRWACINATPGCKAVVFGGCMRPILWVTSPDPSPYVTKLSPTKYSALLPLPDAGKWRAFMIELRFKNPYGDQTEYYFTSPISVIPDTAPFPPCKGDGCYGTLV